MKISRWLSINHNRRRENDDNRAIQSEEEEKERERERVTFFDVGIYFRPISGIPRRKYPPRSSAGCITRRGMRRAERKKIKKKKCEEEIEGERRRIYGKKREEKGRRIQVKTRRHATSFDSTSVFCTSLLKRRAVHDVAKKFLAFLSRPSAALSSLTEDCSIWRMRQSNWSWRPLLTHCSFKRCATIWQVTLLYKRFCSYNWIKCIIFLTIIIILFKRDYLNNQG